MTRVLMVCLGNICRSPTAEAVLRHKLRIAGIEATVESAGTGDWHVGGPPDRRATLHAKRRGYDLSSLRARQVQAGDFERFDLILAMDAENLAELVERCPPQHRTKLAMLVDHCVRHRVDRVPDPYAGGPASFEEVLDLVEDACDGLVTKLQQRNRGA
jgi:protein-tyrosine phosphatase